MKAKSTCLCFACALALGLLTTNLRTVRAELEEKRPVAAPGMAETDRKIESSFKETYVYKKYLKDDRISIIATDGKVTLTGTTSSSTDKALAEKTAESLPGVTYVKNEITLNGDQPKEKSDDWVAFKVRAALMFHKNVDGFHTKIRSREGAVTLQGRASSQAEKDLATEYTKDVEGVVSVDNQMMVAQMTKEPPPTIGEKIDDASITAKAKMVLLSHRSTSAVRTKVHTTDGVITVTGKAKNAAEKDLVSKLLYDMNGVKKVVNEMEIERSEPDKG